MLAIRAGGDPYAVQLAETAGLHADRRLTSVPGALPEMLGIAGIRGLLVPVYDLAALLGHGSASAPRWFLLAQGREAVGLAFDAYEQHIRLPQASLDAAGTTEPGDATAPAHKHLRGTLEVDGVLRPIIDVAALLRTLGARLGTKISSTGGEGT
jgi:purine-binding chemotaxis protein CheW